MAVNMKNMNISADYGQQICCICFYIRLCYISPHAIVKQPAHQDKL